MSPLVISVAPRTVPSPARDWHIGISPVFPSTLILSDDSAIETLLTDIPFLSVGLLGFGVVTFFFVLRKFNRIAFFIFASVILAFIAGVLDVGQVLVRGRASTDSDTHVSSVLPLLIARELSLALSIGIRFLFFWSFVSRPPRGERPLLSWSSSQEQRPNFLRMESDIHSGSWMRYGLAGALLKYILLLATLAIPVLQLIWRLSAEFSRVGPVYNADSILEIVTSAIFVIKLSANSWVSPLTPRWKTVRDYLPVVVALLLGMGVGIGNILCFQFSETSLGRFLQAVELYVLVLYILISSFYTQRQHLSLLGTPRARGSKVPTPFDGIETVDRVSSFRITPPTVATPENIRGSVSLRTATPNLPRSKRMSSWLVAEAKPFQAVLVVPQNKPTTSRLASWLSNKRSSGQKDREESRLWTKEDVESAKSPADEKMGYAASPEPSLSEPRETTTWRDPAYTSVVPSTTASQRLERITTALNAPSSNSRNGPVSADGTISSFAAAEFYGRDFSPPRLPNPPGSPIYGLDGIVRYYGQNSPEPRPDSVQSSGMESLLRQQAELDKSVAELQFFSPSVISGGRLAATGGQPESFRSDFSLSNFPEPPPIVSSTSIGEEVAEPFKDEQQSKKSVVPKMPITAKPSQTLEVVTESRRPQSFPSTTRSSIDSAVLGTANRAFLGSGGTQYDVTSFIGDLTTPALKESSQNDKPKRPVSLVVEQAEPDDGSIQAQPTADPAPPVERQVQVLPPALIVDMNTKSRVNSPPLKRTKQGLPSRTRLNISGPIPRANVEKSMEYERPRPVPVP